MSDSFNSIEVFPESFKVKNRGVDKVNKLGTLNFIVFDPVLGKEFTADLSHPIYNGFPHICWCLSEMYLEHISGGKGWSNLSTQSLTGRKGTSNNGIITLKRLGVWWAKNKPESKLHDWSIIDVQKLFTDVLELKVDWNDKNSSFDPRIKNDILNRGIIEKLKLSLNRSENNYVKGISSDGLTFKINEKEIKKWFSPILIKKKIMYEEWKKGESWRSIPLPIAMLVLSDAIDIVRDSKTKFLIKYFQHQRSNSYYSVNSIFGSSKIFERFCLGKWGRSGKNIPAKNDNWENAKSMYDLICDHYGDGQTKFPMTHDFITMWCNKVYSASLVILLCLTGARVSELASMKGGALAKNYDGSWDFESEIIKTNHGISTVRAVHGLAAEAINALEELSYFDKNISYDGAELYLFGKFFSMKAKFGTFNIKTHRQGASKQTLYYTLNEFYSDFLDKHPEIRDICPNIHPHMFRHTFAEFSLRRFEGDVHEAVRRHFRHSNGSFMTNIYLADKEKESFLYAEEVMIREVAEKMILQAQKTLNQESFDPLIFGAAMKAAIDLLEVRVVSTNSELEAVIDEFSDSFERIVPHEYGYCMPRTETINQSKCFDKISKTAIVDNAWFLTCSSCLHSVQNINTHKAAIMQIGLTHSHQMTSIEATSIFPTKSNSSYLLSKRAFEAAQKKIIQMEKSNIIASSVE